MVDWSPRFRRMGLVGLLFFATWPGLAHAATEDVKKQATRFGEVQAIARDDGAYDLSLGGHLIAPVRAAQADEALGVLLYLVTADGPVDYVLVDLWVPGLRCRHEFFVLALDPGKPPRLSESFGACHELMGAEYQPDGVIVTLAPSQVFDAGGEDAAVPDPQVVRFRWRDGCIAELPADPS